MKSRISTIILIIIFIAGLSLLLYPTVSDYLNSLHQASVISSYTKVVAELDEDYYNQVLAVAQEYNSKISKHTPHWNLTEKEMDDYSHLIDFNVAGVFGYIEIPKLNTTLAIYHGTDEGVLQLGVGHLPGSSLPIGGESTHSVLSGHRGLPSAKLFTNLDKLEIGDIFVLSVLNSVMTYEVDQIKIVEPDNLNDLKIVEGEDLCTLVTCTPYGINTHRLLVRGHRVENNELSKNIYVTSEAIQIEPVMVAPIFAVPLLVVIILFVFVTRKKKTYTYDDFKNISKF